MGEFEVFGTDELTKQLLGLEKREQDWIYKIMRQLKTNPFSGKPLRFDWFREKKFENKQLYFVVAKGKKQVLLIAFGDKKKQQKIIDTFWVNREIYQGFANQP